MFESTLMLVAQQSVRPRSGLQEHACFRACLSLHVPDINKITLLPGGGQIPRLRSCFCIYLTDHRQPSQGFQ